jgi:mRNA-degrading endonuclease RelE of RelBE toxin-antitoxin system
MSYTVYIHYKIDDDRIFIEIVVIGHRRDVYN